MNVNLENIPTTHIINFHRETSDILYTRLLKSTLQVSKLDSNKKRTQDLLRKEKVENKLLESFTQHADLFGQFWPIYLLS